MLTPEMSPVVLQSLRFDIETISPTAGYQVAIGCGASFQDGTALNGTYTAGDRFSKFVWTKVCIQVRSNCLWQ